ncbi:MAG TPA: MEDS domain-containing protein [Polyangia bacterium]
MSLGGGMRSRRYESLMRGFAGPAVLSLPAQPNHIVQFYDSTELLVSSISSFVATGLSLGEGVVIAATRAHRLAVGSALARRGVGLDEAEKAGRCVLLDAEEAADRLLINESPDWERFQALVAPAIASASGGEEARPVRVYGEIVDLLWNRGKRAAALKLEGFWNRLADRCAFSLLCAYSMAGLYETMNVRAPAEAHARAHHRGHSHRHSFDDVCRTHSHVIPAPTYVRLRAEIEHRKNLERALRDSLRELKALRESFDQVVQQQRGGRESLEAAMGEGMLTVREIGTIARYLVGHADESVIAAAQRIVDRAEDLSAHLEWMVCSLPPSSPAQLIADGTRGQARGNPSKK